MAYEKILYEGSDNGLTIKLKRADRLNAFALEMGQELVEALVPLLVDEIAGQGLKAENVTQIRVARAAGGSP